MVYVNYVLDFVSYTFAIIIIIIFFQFRISYFSYFILDSFPILFTFLNTSLPAFYIIYTQAQ